MAYGNGKFAPSNTEVILENHGTRLDDVEEDVKEVQGELKELRPKSISKIKIALTFFGILVTLLGAWWKLSSEIGDKPSNMEVKTLIQDYPNDKMMDKLDDLVKAQNDILIILENIDGKIKRIEEKVN